MSLEVSVRLSSKNISSQGYSSEDIFNPNDFVFFISDSLANDGSLISSGLQGQIIKKYPTQRGNLVYLVRVGDKEVPAFAENIRMAMRLSNANDEQSEQIRAEYDSLKHLPMNELCREYRRYFKVSTPEGNSKDLLISDILRARYGNRRVDEAFGFDGKVTTAGEDPAAFDSTTDCPSGAQTDIGGTATRTHASPILQLKDDEHVTYKYNPQHGEWDKVFEKVARLVNGQINPTPASVSPFASQLQDLSINYQSNPQGTFNAQQVSDTLNSAIKTPEEQVEIENQQNQQAEQVANPQQQQQPQQKSASSGNITSPADHDRSQIEEDDDGTNLTSIDIDGPNQSHQIQTKNKADDDVFDWLPSPFDIGEDGNYRTQPGGPNAWL